MATFDASKLNLPFMKYRLTALVVSLVLVIGSLLLLGTKGVNFSVDFSGGVALQLEFESPVNVGDIRKTLSDMGKGQATIQAYDERNVLIRYQDTGDAVRKEMLSALEAKYGEVKIQKIDEIGPVVGKELRKQAFIAVTLAIIGILAA